MKGIPLNDKVACQEAVEFGDDTSMVEVEVVFVH
jgi:hypothetical protein